MYNNNNNNKIIYNLDLISNANVRVNPLHGIHS